MSNEILEEFTAVIDRFISVFQHDTEMRSTVRSFAHAILAATDHQAEDTNGGTAAVEFVEDQHPSSEVADRPPVEVLAKSLWPVVSDTIVEGSAAKLRVLKTVTDDIYSCHELGLIEKRCRLKAEGLRWSVERQRRLRVGVDFANEIKPRDKELIFRANAVPNCFLWMSHKSSPPVLNGGAWEEAACCFRRWPALPR